MIAATYEIVRVPMIADPQGFTAFCKFAHKDQTWEFVDVELIQRIGDEATPILEYENLTLAQSNLYLDYLELLYPEADITDLLEGCEALGPREQHNAG